jgi:hypothetical protein
LDQNAVAQATAYAVARFGYKRYPRRVNTQAGASSNIGQLGLANQSAFLGQQQNVYDTQNSNDVNYEQRRQADAQRRSQNVFGLGQSMIGMGGKALAGA